MKKKPHINQSIKQLAEAGLLPETKPPIRFNDSTVVGILNAFGHEFIGIPVGNRTEFDVSGDVEATLAKIAKNALVGSRDVLQGIKAARQAIWLFKHGGRGNE